MSEKPKPCPICGSDAADYKFAPVASRVYGKCQNMLCPLSDYSLPTFIWNGLPRQADLDAAKIRASENCQICESRGLRAWMDDEQKAKSDLKQCREKLDAANARADKAEADLVRFRSLSACFATGKIYIPDEPPPKGRISQRWYGAAEPDASDVDPPETDQCDHNSSVTCPEPHDRHCGDCYLQEHTEPEVDPHCEGCVEDSLCKRIGACPLDWDRSPSHRHEDGIHWHCWEPSAHPDQDGMDYLQAVIGDNMRDGYSVYVVAGDLITALRARLGEATEQQRASKRKVPRYPEEKTKNECPKCGRSGLSNHIDIDNHNSEWSWEWSSCLACGHQSIPRKVRTAVGLHRKATTEGGEV